LDVFEIEPLPKHNKLIKLKNVILLPHLGSATVQTRNQMSKVAAINLINILSNKKPIFLVNTALEQKT
jgi:glyoxylate reductase